jgi:putative transposase
MPAYGYRQMTHELRRRGLVVNHKRVLRLMREDNLLCLQKKRLVRVTDTPHGFEFYPNLVLALTLSGPDQLWAAAITYVRLPCEFVYLAVLLDAYSRRSIGCALDGSLEAKLSLAAIHMVLEGRVVRPGLVQRSDRGVQYASRAYTNLLNAQGIQISMSRPGNPYDNAQAETFIRTVKHEHVYLCEYQNLAESRRQIGHFI